MVGIGPERERGGMGDHRDEIDPKRARESADSATIGCDDGAPPTISLGTPESCATLVRILDEYMAALQAGRAPSRAELLAQHPAHAEQLEQCLAGIEFIHNVGSKNCDEPAQLGEFRLLREIGRGGMGVVYEAEQTSLKRRVALKVLRFGVVADEDATKRFLREATTVARLHHTNIVPIFAIGTEKSVHFYAMQFIEGRSLADVITETQRGGESLPVAQVVRWGMQAAEALAHAHQRGVVHRDVKPSNLLLDTEDTLWLTDFGLAKNADEVTLTVTGALMGTPRYMSPEQAESLNRPIDHRTDIYSLGASLYELATNRPVFEAKTTHGVISRILADEPAPPRQARPSLPRDLETIILTCLAKEPAKRYASAQDLADDLRAVSEARPIKARRMPLHERVLRFVQKNKKAVASAAIATAASALLLIGGLLGWNLLEKSRLGWVTLTTEGPPLTARLLRAHRDEQVGEEFTVPTRTPVPLPEGDYRVELTGKGQLSETAFLGVNRGQRQRFAVTLNGTGSRERWMQSGLESDFHLETVNLAGHADVIERRREVFRRRDGATGKVQWEVTLDATRPPQGQDASEWSAALMNRLDLVQPAADLNGDGTRDLIWGSGYMPALLVLSGKDGALLWCHRGRRALPPSRDVIQRSLPPVVTSSVGATPAASNPATISSIAARGYTGKILATADLDADGVVDPIVLYGELKGDGVLPSNAPANTTNATIWVEALSGKDGRRIWYQEINPLPLKPLRSGNFEYTIWGPDPIRLKGRELLAIAAGTRWVGLDVKTGAPIGAPINLDVVPQREAYQIPFVPIRPEQYADVDGDGEPEILVLGDGPGGEQVAALAAVSLANAKPLWTTSVRSRFVTEARAGGSSELPKVSAWPMIADLDGDGKSEIIVPDQFKRPGELPENSQKGLRVLDGATGTTRWTRTVRTYQDWTAVERFTAGPDLDGDHVRELFAASYMPRVINDGLGTETRTGYLYVDALSGKDGRRLWWWGTPVDWTNEQIAPLRWWQANPDGWPMLVVSSGSWQSWGERVATYLLDSETGRLAHSISSAYVSGVADFDGDSLPDLLCNEPIPGNRRTLRMFRGTAPDAWSRFGSWTPTYDLDGDGVHDLLSDSPQERWWTAISGRDGRRLWRASMNLGGSSFAPASDYFTIAELNRQVQETTPRIDAKPHNDLDGDGKPDLLVTRGSYSAANLGPGLPVAAISGATGSTLWSGCPAPLQKRRVDVLVWRGSDARDVDGDGDMDVHAVYELNGMMPPTPGVFWWRDVRLVRISGRDGTVIHDVTLGESALPDNYNAISRTTLYPIRIADLDGDGAPEAVIAVPAPVASQVFSHEIIAVSCRDGRVLWRWRAARRLVGRDVNNNNPVFALGDLDGDGRTEVVAVDESAGKVKILALNGSDGTVRWTWDGEPSSAESVTWSTLPPLLVDLQGNGHRAVFVAVELAGSGRQYVLLDELGHLRERRPLDGDQYPLATDDLDGDGRMELLFQDRGKLVATRGGLQNGMWSRGSALFQVRPRGPSGHVTLLDSLLFGIDGATGRPRWGSGGGPLSAMVDKVDQSALPLFVGRQGDVTVCRQTQAVSPAATYTVPPGPQPRRTYRTPTDDPRWLRSLPGPGPNRHDISYLLAMLVGVGVSAIIVAPPLIWARRVIRRRRSALWEWYLIPVWAALVFLLYRGYGYYRIRFGAPEASPGMLALLFALGIPILFLLSVIGVRAVQGRWRRVLSQVAFVGISIVAMAAFMIAVDRRAMLPEEHYSWEGWEHIVVLGAYAAGLWLLLAGVLREVAIAGWRTTRRALDMLRRAPVKEQPIAA
jgi:serine/threonine protein kinase